MEVMKSFDCLELLSPLITDELMVIGMTSVNYQWRALSPPRDGNLFIGSMGNPLAVGIGLAISLPHRRVVVLETDGSSMIGLSSLTTLGRYRPPNLKILVFDNQAYSGSRISVPSDTSIHADLEAIARGAGVPATTTVRDLDSFEREARAALNEAGVRYVVAKVEEDKEMRRLPKPTMDHVENKYRFIRHVESTEGRAIFPTLR